MKHTPGPWVVGSQSEFGTHNANFVYASDKQTGICQVYGMPMHTKLEEVIGDDRWAEGLANAYLMAAAPEIYEALKMQYCVQCKGMIGLPKKHEFECSCDQARAAIAKAEGKK